MNNFEKYFNFTYNPNFGVSIGVRDGDEGGGGGGREWRTKFGKSSSKYLGDYFFFPLLAYQNMLSGILGACMYTPMPILE